MRPPTPEEDDLLDRALAPALDVGCGPGRIVLALCRRGIMAVGVDTAPAAADLARAQGAPVLERSIFDRLPGSGRWGSAILLDGNIGIGGDPVALLRRIAALLRPGGRVLLELDPPGRESRSFRARLDDGFERSAWFPWARLGVDHVGWSPRPRTLGSKRSGLPAVDGLPASPRGLELSWARPWWGRWPAFRQLGVAVQLKKASIAYWSGR